METFNKATLMAFADELEKIGSIDSMEKEAILGRLLSRGLSPKMLAAAKMGEKELAGVASKGGMGALRGPMNVAPAALKHVGSAGQAAAKGLKPAAVVKGM